ncbi:MAG TPA: C25 family cysteine peptidase, partial [candidate division Zixibacteria bacterium]|nr:C25 family cysteine peptidase [candidate division Zixibacteria bacterium]
MRSAGEKWGSLCRWLAVGLALCGALSPDVASAETAVGIPFPADGLRADLAERSLEFENWSTIDLPSGLSIAVQNVWLPVAGPVDADLVKIAACEQRWLGTIEPSALAALDAPTAADGRYSAVKPSWSALFDGGFVGAAVEGIVTVGGERFVRALVSPYQIDSAGNVFAVSEITIRAESPLGAPLVGAAEWRAVSEGAASHSAQRGSSAGSAVSVIVTNETLREPLQRLADYKSATGIATEVALIEDILATYNGIDEAASLRDYLKTFFIHGGRFVLLAGDETALPVRYAYYYNTYSQPPLENLMVCDL